MAIPTDCRSGKGVNAFGSVIRKCLSEELERQIPLLPREAIARASVDNCGKIIVADSLDVVELLMSIEDEFEVEIPDEEIEKLKTIGDVVEYIQNNMA